MIKLYRNGNTEAKAAYFPDKKLVSSTVDDTR